ncbi:MAG: glycosyltransferase family 4 protein [Armatimonadota bacterium]|nr:glycosyltransferase family 4 protein [Armatimonadota bacterium]
MSAEARLPILGLSDPLNAPTGFGRVARELFTRLPQDRLRLGHLSRGWIGSRRFAGIQTYSADWQDVVCADAFPVAAADFGLPLVLWTLLDPWQTGWLSHPERNAYATERSRRFLRDHRGQIVWIGHYPIDGEGPRDGPALWVEDFLRGPDVVVLMTEWARKLVAPLLPDRDVRVISHAVDVARYYPGDGEAAKAQLEEAYARRMLEVVRALRPGADESEQRAEAEARTFRLRDRYVVLAVMANRARKYWPDVLRAFAALSQRVPTARLIGLCGDPAGNTDDSWPLLELCRQWGLRPAGAPDVRDPNVLLLDVVGGPPEAEDDALRLLYQAADVAVLLSGGEGFGLPQLEAHACGRPCLVGGYSASAELAVDPRETIAPRGFSYVGNNMVRRPVYAWQDLVDRLMYAARHPGWRREVGAAGVAQARARSWERILPEWLRLFAQAGARIRPTEEAIPDAQSAEAVAAAGLAGGPPA